MTVKELSVADYRNIEKININTKKFVKKIPIHSKKIMGRGARNAG